MTETLFDFDPNDQEELMRRLQLVARAFSPASPITNRDLFSGRVSQLNRLSDITHQRGQHALVYGERGVGKTSLCRVVMTMCQGEERLAVYYTCASGDTFDIIWRKVFAELSFTVKANPYGFTAPARDLLVGAVALLPDTELVPDDVRRVLARLGENSRTVVFIDEFDRPTDPVTRTLFADTIKILSDQGIDATLVLVGVGSAVTDLLTEHASIGRSLVQVSMPIMSQQECTQIVTNGMNSAEMRVEDPFVDRVVVIAQGFPHYVHLIAQHGARHCVESARSIVTGGDSVAAVELAVEDVSQSVREAHHRATFSNRETIYGDVLLACALAKKDDLGQFGSADLREPLRRVTGREYDIPAFSSHLNSFSSSDGPRGQILRKFGESRFRYRFIDPLMPPYILMRGHASGLL